MIRITRISVHCNNGPKWRMIIICHCTSPDTRILSLMMIFSQKGEKRVWKSKKLEVLMSLLHLDHSDWDWSWIHSNHHQSQQRKKRKHNYSRQQNSIRTNQVHLLFLDCVVRRGRWYNKICGLLYKSIIAGSSSSSGWTLNFEDQIIFGCSESHQCCNKHSFITEWVGVGCTWLA